MGYNDDEDITVTAMELKERLKREIDEMDNIVQNKELLNFIREYRKFHGPLPLTPESKNKAIYCKDCDDIPARIAEYYITLTDYWIFNYTMPRKYPLCASCLIDILDDRYMGGGGPTSGDVLKIIPIYPREQRGYHYKWEYFMMKLHQLFRVHRRSGKETTDFNRWRNCPFTYYNRDHKSI